MDYIRRNYNNLLALLDALIYKGGLAMAANYPAADAGHVYIISTGGVLGSGPTVIAGDLIVCKTDGTVTGTHAAVGASWDIIEANVDWTAPPAIGGTTPSTGAFTTLGSTMLPNHEIYVDGGRSDTYTADGSMLKPYKTVVLAVAAIETDAAIHIAAVDYQGTTYVVRIAPGTYSDAFTLTNEKYLRFEGFGVILSGIITLTQTEQVGDYYSRLEFKGMEGTRARRGQSFTITGAINANRSGGSTYLHFDGVNLTGALDVQNASWVTHFNNCYVSGALSTSGTSPQMQLETTNHTEFASAMTGNIAFRDVRDAIFLSGTINTTPQDTSRITNTRFTSTQSITITGSQTLSIDSQSLKSLLATTENLTTMVLDHIGLVADGTYPGIIDRAAPGAIGATTPAAGKFSTLENTGALTLLYYDTIYIPAASMTPTATNGAVGGSKEFATNDINGDYLAFDTATEQYAEFQIPMPENWDRSTIKAKFFWSPTDDTGSTANTVEWAMQAGALSNDDAFDAALGTEQVISDTVLAGESGDLHITGATNSLTVGGSPSLGDLTHFKIYRHPSGTDDYGANALLWGVWIQYKATNTVATW